MNYGYVLFSNIDLIFIVTWAISGHSTIQNNQLGIQLPSLILTRNRDWRDCQWVHSHIHTSIESTSSTAYTIFCKSRCFIPRNLPLSTLKMCSISSHTNSLRSLVILAVWSLKPPDCLDLKSSNFSRLHRRLQTICAPCSWAVFSLPPLVS